MMCLIFQELEFCEAHRKKISAMPFLSLCMWVEVNVERDSQCRCLQLSRFVSWQVRTQLKCESCLLMIVTAYMAYFGCLGQRRV